MYIAGYFSSAIEQIGNTFEPHHWYHEVYFSSRDESLYLDFSRWGLLGNHSDIVITTEDPRKADWKFDPDRDYRFMTRMYYKAQNDSLIVYSSSMPDLPKNFKSGIVLVPKELSRDEESLGVLYNHEQNGFTQIGPV